MMIPENPETVPGDREGDYPVKAGNTDMIILVVIFAIVFAYVSRWF